MIWKSLGFQLAAVVVVVAILALAAPWHEARHGPANYSESPTEDRITGPLWSPGPEGDPHENATHHWQKHGREFPELHGEADYIAAARRFVSHPPPGAEMKHDTRGDTLIYDPQTNTFAVRTPDGAPRTMFRPNSGRAYWERQ